MSAERIVELSPAVKELWVEDRCVWKREEPACPSCGSLERDELMPAGDGRGAISQCRGCDAKLELIGSKLTRIDPDPAESHKRAAPDARGSTFQKNSPAYQAFVDELNALQLETTVRNDYFKRLELAPETITPEETQREIDEAARPYVETALRKEEALNPGASMTELAKRAWVAARAVAVELNPAFSRPTGTAVAKSADLVKALADEKEAWLGIEQIADRLQAADPKLSRPASISRALLTPEGQGEYTKYSASQRRASRARSQPEES